MLPKKPHSSLIKMIRSAVLATDTTCLPRPRPADGQTGVTAAFGTHLSQHLVRYPADRVVEFVHLHTPALRESPVGRLSYGMLVGNSYLIAHSQGCKLICSRDGLGFRRLRQ